MSFSFIFKLTRYTAQLLSVYNFFIINQHKFTKIKIITYFSMSQINNDKYDYGPKSFGLSARTSWFDSGDRTLPGPGQHQNLRLDRTNPPQWNFGTSTQRDTFLQKHHFPYPPPNNYTTKVDYTHASFPKFSIPQATQQHKQKHIDDKNQLLYKPNYYAGKDTAPKFTMGYFQQMDYRTCTPSPNQYHNQTQRQFFNKTQRSFSTSQRPQPYGQNGKFPASTAYPYEKYPYPKIQFTIGNSQRPNILEGPDAPGTFYEIAGDLRKSGTGKTFGPQYSIVGSKKQDYPAPTKYTPLQLKSRQNIITTYSNRAPLQNKAVLNNPSPQKYSTQMDFYKKRSYSFSKDSREKSYIMQSPGPGAHDVVAEFKTTSGVMGRKLKEPVKLITPGADHYIPKKQFTSQSPPRVINYYSNRADFSKSITGRVVGPGSYKIQKQDKAELGRMSKSMKFGKQPNKNPGPGSYYIPSSIGKLPKYYTGTKKVSHQGYSTFTMQMWQKQRQQQKRVEQLQKSRKVQQQVQNSSQSIS